MEYVAIAVAVLGMTVGAMFRLRFLLGVVALVLTASLVYSMSHGFAFWDTMLNVMVPQAILQVSYVLGLASHGFFPFAQRKLTTFFRAEAEHLRKPQDG